MNEFTARRPARRSARRILWSALSGGLLLLGSIVATVSSAAPGTAPPTKPRKPHPSCTQMANRFRERLEPVVEALIDNHPEEAGPAAARARRWWKANHRAFRLRAAADSLVPAMAQAGLGGRPLEAARLSVVLSDASFAWCSRTPSLRGHLFRIDLVGMTASLRTRGVDLDWPRGHQESRGRVLGQLRARSQGALADSLETAITAAMEIPVAEGGDDASARRLLDLVDVAEKRLK